jgi:hypothetical protein
MKIDDYITIVKIINQKHFQWVFVEHIIEDYVWLSLVLRYVGAWEIVSYLMSFLEYLNKYIR